MSNVSSAQSKKTSAPFGSWTSPIRSHDLVSQAVRLGEPQLDGNDIYWIEGRPQEQGRGVLLKRAFDDNSAQGLEVLPKRCNLRSRAHEYGGASYTVEQGVVYFVEAADQRIYRFDPERDDAPVALSPEGHFRYADLCVDTLRQRILCVREDHHTKQAASAPPQDQHIEETNELVSLACNNSSEPKVIASGCDFYSNPQISPDGQKLSWLSWNHPSMPWDSTQCWLAHLDKGGLCETTSCVAGGDGNESIFQPQWSPSGELFLVSDRDNWWNIYRYCTTTTTLEAVTKIQAEFATPQWVFGMSCYGFAGNDEILACYTQEGRWKLASINTHSKKMTPIDNPFCDISGIRCKPTHGRGRGVILAAGANSFASLIRIELGSSEFSVVAQSASSELGAGDISVAQPISFDSARFIADISSGPSQAHGFYYPPTNQHFDAPSGEAPPLIVLGHGGPTGATETGLNFKIQYWTSRGFAVMDVNYRGSTGYGRNYRQQLHKQWGVKDVEDVCAAADYLIEQGLADPERVTIKGSSAGGYTVLAALTFRDTFKAGTSLYGIGDLETLARDTHKFEARYLDSLVGAYPEQQALYQARSPIHHAQQLNCPVIFFQGLEDKVVPPAQAESMVAILDAKKVPVAYVPFEGEGHGFRQAFAIARAIDAELSFYAQVFSFALSAQDQAIEPVDVKNLAQAISEGQH